MLFREAIQSFDNLLLSTLNIQESQSIVFGVPPYIPPKIKHAPQSKPKSMPCICQIENSASCNLCHGTKIIQESGTFFKFLNAIIDFKIGRSQKTGQCEEKSNALQQIKRVETQSNTNLPHSSQFSAMKKVGKSLSMNDKTQMQIESSSKLAHSAPVVMHNGVQCDGCRAYPLLGARFQCTTCQSYDLCEVCHRNIESKHQHSFRKVDVPKREIIKRTLKQQFRKTRSFQSTVL